MWFKSDIKNMLLSLLVTHRRMEENSGEKTDFELGYERGFKDGIQAVGVSFGILIPNEKGKGEG